MMAYHECERGNNRHQVHGNNSTPPWRMSQKQDAKYMFDLVGFNSYSVDPCLFVPMHWCWE